MELYRNYNFMTEQPFCCCFYIREYTQLLAEKKATNAIIQCCNININQSSCCDCLLICPVWVCSMCTTYTLMAPKDCYWCTSNCCSLCVTDWRDMYYGDQLDRTCEYLCCPVDEPILYKYESSINNGLSRGNAFRGLFDLSPISDINTHINSTKKPLDQYMH